MEVRALRHDDAREAARVLAEAFREDPFWAVVGPRLRWQRRLVTAATNRVELASATRRSDPAFVAEEGGRPAGIALLAIDSPATGIWPLLHSWGLALGGPRTLRQARVVGRAVGDARPPGRHVYLASLAVRPQLQHRGIGSALLERVSSLADERRLTLALETMRPENVAFYERFGLRVTGHAQPLERLDVWFMQRDPQSDGTRSTSSSP